MEGMTIDNRTALEATMRQRATTDWQTAFWPAFFLGIITCGIYWFFIIYKLMDRRLQHFERMISFRYYMIQMIRERAQVAGRTEELAPDIQQLEGLHLEASNRDRAGEKSPVLWLVLSIVVGVVIYYVYYFLNDDFRAHETNEHIFLLRASEIMQKLGMTNQQIVTSPMVPERNFVTFIILTIITCGIYGIYWWYTLITDVNNHFDHHALWESQVYTIISQG